MAKFWERLMVEEEEMLTWTEIQRMLWSPVLESKDATAWSVSSSEQLSWPHYLRQTLGLSCLCLTCCKDRTRSRPTHCLWLDVSPCPRQRGCCSAETGLSPALKSRGRRKALEEAQGWQEGAAVWLGLLKPGRLGFCKFAIPDAETQLVKMFHICHFTELSWSNKDAYGLLVAMLRKARGSFFWIAPIGK